MGVTNRINSTRPRSWLYSDIPRPDAPVTYTGAFPILTARPDRRSICNIRTGVVQKVLRIIQKKKAIEEHFCCGKTVTSIIKFEKLIQTFVLIAV